MGQNTCSQETTMNLIDRLKSLDPTSEITLLEDNNLFNINNQLKIHRLALDQFEKEELINMLDVTKELNKNLPELSGETRNKLASLKGKYRLCYECDRLNARKKIEYFQEKLNMDPSMDFLQNSSPYEDLNFCDTLEPYNKREKLILAAAGFAQKMTLTTLSEFTAYIQFAMSTFERAEEYLYNKKYIENFITGAGNKILTPKEKKKLSDQIRKEQNIVLNKGEKLHDHYWKRLETEILSNDGLLKESALNDLKLRYNRFQAQANINRCEIYDVSLTNDDIPVFIKNYAANQKISFSTIPQTIYHYMKHEDIKINKMNLKGYILHSNLIISESHITSVVATVSQDGNAKRFVFKYEHGRIEYWAIVVECNKKIFLATCLGKKTASSPL